MAEAAEETPPPPIDSGSGGSSGATTHGRDANVTTPTQSTTATIENAAELSFGPEFHDIHILSNAQVAVILQHSARSAMNRDEELHDVYRKTQKYVNRFNGMTNPEKDPEELVNELDNLQE
uniref:Uncharacterized protein n=1 Tax=Ditylum brightwellii TaxID=49249 RepID=A0A6V2BR61_9STRA